jgi:hypothetical protein
MKNVPNQAEVSIWGISTNGHEIRNLFQLRDDLGGNEISLHSETETSSDTSRCIVRKTPSKIEFYQPLEAKKLFLKFQELKRDPKMILVFADQWGLLGANISHDFVASRKGGKVIQGEDLSDWYSEIRDMQHACYLLEKLKVKEAKDLGSFVHRRKDIIHWEDKFGIRAFLRKQESKDTWETLNKCPDPASDEAVAWLVLQDIVNKRLENRMSSKIFREQDGNYVLRIVPEGLIGCLWHQFACIMTSSYGVRSCKKCGKLFVPKHEDTEFCNTPKCKSKQQRVQKESERALSLE